MSFTEAIRTCFSKYATFTGRARRPEYWWFALFGLIVYVVTAILDAAAGTPIFIIIGVLALLVPSLAVAVRRLHDTSRSGWWYFIALVPLIGGIILLVFMATDSTPGPNQYDTASGPNQYGGTPGPNQYGGMPGA